MVSPAMVISSAEHAGSARRAGLPAVAGQGVVMERLFVRLALEQQVGNGRMAPLERRLPGTSQEIALQIRA